MTNKIQITVTERNQWERETFAYVLMVSPADADRIKEKIESGSRRTELSFALTNITREEIDKMNASSHNGYMSRIETYEFEKNGEVGDWLEKWLEDSEKYNLFYKATGLTRLK